MSTTTTPITGKIKKYLTPPPEGEPSFPLPLGHIPAPPEGMSSELPLPTGLPPLSPTPFAPPVGEANLDPSVIDPTKVDAVNVTRSLPGAMMRAMSDPIEVAGMKVVPGMNPMGMAYNLAKQMKDDLFRALNAKALEESFTATNDFVPKTRKAHQSQVSVALPFLGNIPLVTVRHIPPGMSNLDAAQNIQYESVLWDFAPTLPEFKLWMLKGMSGLLANIPEISPITREMEQTPAIRAIDAYVRGTTQHPSAIKTLYSLARLGPDWRSTVKNQEELLTHNGLSIEDIQSSGETANLVGSLVPVAPANIAAMGGSYALRAGLSYAVPRVGAKIGTRAAAAYFRNPNVSLKASEKLVDWTLNRLGPSAFKRVKSGMVSRAAKLMDEFGLVMDDAGRISPLKPLTAEQQVMMRDALLKLAEEFRNAGVQSGLVWMKRANTAAIASTVAGEAGIGAAVGAALTVPGAYIAPQEEIREKYKESIAPAVGLGAGLGGLVSGILTAIPRRVPVATSPGLPVRWSKTPSAYSEAGAPYLKLTFPRPDNLTPQATSALVKIEQSLRVAPQPQVHAMVAQALDSSAVANQVLPQLAAQIPDLPFIPPEVSLYDTPPTAVDWEVNPREAEFRQVLQAFELAGSRGTEMMYVGTFRATNPELLDLKTLPVFQKEGRLIAFNPSTNEPIDITTGLGQLSPEFINPKAGWEWNPNPAQGFLAGQSDGLGFVRYDFDQASGRLVLNPKQPYTIPIEGYEIFQSTRETVRRALSFNKDYDPAVGGMIEQQAREATQQMFTSPTRSLDDRIAGYEAMGLDPETAAREALDDQAKFLTQRRALADDLQTKVEVYQERGLPFVDRNGEIPEVVPPKLTPEERGYLTVEDLRPAEMQPYGGITHPLDSVLGGIEGKFIKRDTLLKRMKQALTEEEWQQYQVDSATWETDAKGRVSVEAVRTWWDETREPVYVAMTGEEGMNPFSRRLGPIPLPKVDELAGFTFNAAQLGMGVVLPDGSTGRIPGQSLSPRTREGADIAAYGGFTSITPSDLPEGFAWDEPNAVILVGGERTAKGPHGPGHYGKNVIFSSIAQRLHSPDGKKYYLLSEAQSDREVSLRSGAKTQTELSPEAVREHVAIGVKVTERDIEQTIKFLDEQQKLLGNGKDFDVPLNREYTWGHVTAVTDLVNWVRFRYDLPPDFTMRYETPLDDVRNRLFNLQRGRAPEYSDLDFVNGFVQVNTDLLNIVKSLEDFAETAQLKLLPFLEPLPHAREALLRVNLEIAAVNKDDYFAWGTSDLQRRKYGHGTGTTWPEKLYGNAGTIGDTLTPAGGTIPATLAKILGKDLQVEYLPLNPKKSLPAQYADELKELRMGEAANTPYNTARRAVLYKNILDDVRAGRLPEEVIPMTLWQEYIDKPDELFWGTAEGQYKFLEDFDLQSSGILFSLDKANKDLTRTATPGAPRIAAIKLTPELRARILDPRGTIRAKGVTFARPSFWKGPRRGRPNLEEATLRKKINDTSKRIAHLEKQLANASERPDPTLAGVDQTPEGLMAEIERTEGRYREAVQQLRDLRLAQSNSVKEIARLQPVPKDMQIDPDKLRYLFKREMVPAKLQQVGYAYLDDPQGVLDVIADFQAVHAIQTRRAEELAALLEKAGAEIPEWQMDSAYRAANAHVMNELAGTKIKADSDLLKALREAKQIYVEQINAAARNLSEAERFRLVRLAEDLYDIEGKIRFNPKAREISRKILDYERLLNHVNDSPDPLTIVPYDPASGGLARKAGRLRVPRTPEEAIALVGKASVDLHPRVRAQFWRLLPRYEKIHHLVQRMTEAAREKDPHVRIAHLAALDPNGKMPNYTRVQNVPDGTGPNKTWKPTPEELRMLKRHYDRVLKDAGLTRGGVRALYRAALAKPKPDPKALYNLIEAYIAHPERFHAELTPDEISQIFEEFTEVSTRDTLKIQLETLNRTIEAQELEGWASAAPHKMSIDEARGVAEEIVRVLSDAMNREGVTQLGTKKAGYLADPDSPRNNAIIQMFNSFHMIERSMSALAQATLRPSTNLGPTLTHGGIKSVIADPNMEHNPFFKLSSAMTEMTRARNEALAKDMGFWLRAFEESDELAVAVYNARQYLVGGVDIEGLRTSPANRTFEIDISRIPLVDVRLSSKVMGKKATITTYDAVKALKGLFDSFVKGDGTGPLEKARIGIAARKAAVLHDHMVGQLEVIKSSVEELRENLIDALQSGGGAKESVQATRLAIIELDRLLDLDPREFGIEIESNRIKDTLKRIDKDLDTTGAHEKIRRHATAWYEMFGEWEKQMTDIDYVRHGGMYRDDYITISRGLNKLVGVDDADSPYEVIQKIRKESYRREGRDDLLKRRTSKKEAEPDTLAAVGQFMKLAYEISYLEPVLGEIRTEVDIPGVGKRFAGLTVHPDLPNMQRELLGELITRFYNTGRSRPHQALIDVITDDLVSGKPSLASRLARMTMGPKSDPSVIARQRPNAVIPHDPIQQGITNSVAYGIYSTLIHMVQFAALQTLDIANTTGAWSRHTPLALAQSFKDVLGEGKSLAQMAISGRAGHIPDSRLSGGLDMNVDMYEMLGDTSVQANYRRLFDPLGKGARFGAIANLALGRIPDMFYRGMTYNAVYHQAMRMLGDPAKARAMAVMAVDMYHTGNTKLSTSPFLSSPIGRLVRPLLSFMVRMFETTALKGVYGARAIGHRAYRGALRMTGGEGGRFDILSPITPNEQGVRPSRYIEDQRPGTLRRELPSRHMTLDERAAWLALHNEPYILGPDTIPTSVEGAKMIGHMLAGSLVLALAGVATYELFGWAKSKVYPFNEFGVAALQRLTDAINLILLTTKAHVPGLGLRPYEARTLEELQMKMVLYIPVVGRLLLEKEKERRRLAHEAGLNEMPGPWQEGYIFPGDQDLDLTKEEEMEQLGQD